MSGQPPYWRPLKCALEHLAPEVGDPDAAHVLIRQSCYANPDGSSVKVGQRRLYRETHIPVHRLRKALHLLDAKGWTELVDYGRGKVDERRIVLCDRCRLQR